MLFGHLPFPATMDPWMEFSVHRHVGERGSNQAMTPAINMLIGNWHVLTDARILIVPTALLQ
jgi:hypothetical protein